MIKKCDMCDNDAVIKSWNGWNLCILHYKQKTKEENGKQKTLGHTPSRRSHG